MPDVLIRPVPTDAERKRIQAGEKRAWPGVSSSWFANGALGVDTDGFYLIDADGVRTAIACPERGRLIHLKAFRVSDPIPIWHLFVTDEHFHRYVELPSRGFADVDGFGALSDAARLVLSEPVVNLANETRVDYGYPKGKDYTDLEKAVLAASDRHSLRKLFRSS